MAARAPMATLAAMETQTEPPAVSTVSERCRQSWASYEAASREAGERANASWLLIERASAGMAERGAASSEAIA